MTAASLAASVLVLQPGGTGVTAAAPQIAPASARPASSTGITATAVITEASFNWAEPGGVVPVCASDIDAVQAVLWAGKYRTTFRREFFNSFGSSCPDESVGVAKIPYALLSELDGAALALIYADGIVTATSTASFPEFNTGDKYLERYDVQLADGAWRVLQGEYAGEATAVSNDGTPLAGTDYRKFGPGMLMVKIPYVGADSSLAVVTPKGNFEQDDGSWTDKALMNGIPLEQPGSLTRAKLNYDGSLDRMTQTSRRGDGTILYNTQDIHSSRAIVWTGGGDAITLGNMSASPQDYLDNVNNGETGADLRLRLCRGADSDGRRCVGAVYRHERRTDRLRDASGDGW